MTENNDRIVDSFRHNEFTETDARHLENIDQLKEVWLRVFDVTLLGARADLAKRRFDTPAVDLALSVLSIPPICYDDSSSTGLRSIEFRYLLHRLLPDFRKRLFERPTRVIGSDPLPESYAFLSPVISDRFVDHGAQECLDVIRTGYHSFYERHATIESHQRWLSHVGLSRDSRPFIQIHFSDPIFGHKYAPDAPFNPVEHLPQEVFGTTPSHRVFPEKTLEKLGTYAPSYGSLFTCDTVQSLRRSDIPCDMLAAWRFDPKILTEKQGEFDPNHYSEALGLFRHFVLEQVSQGGLVFITFGTGSKDDEAIFRSVFSQCVHRVLQLSDAKYSSFPATNPLRRLFWTGKPLFDYRRISPELIESAVTLADALSISLFIFEVNDSVLTAFDELAKNPRELQRLISLGRKEYERLLNDMKILLTADEGFKTLDLSRKDQRTILGNIARHFRPNLHRPRSRKRKRKRR